jgi:hypothetical protein
VSQNTQDHRGDRTRVVFCANCTSQTSRDSDALPIVPRDIHHASTINRPILSGSFKVKDTPVTADRTKLVRLPLWCKTQLVNCDAHAYSNHACQSRSRQDLTEQKPNVEQRRDGPTKQRQVSLRRSIDPLPLAIPTEATKLQERRASEGKSKRPPRWRGPVSTTDTGRKQS